MLPTYIALVPLEANSSIPQDHLREVAAALQTQVVKDLGPAWGVAGTVSAFARFEDLPPGYLPLAVTKETLPFHHRGFHFVMGGLPFGVVQHSDDDESWTVAASHELLEMLCDPYAQRSILAPSLADAKDDAINGPDPKTGAKRTNAVIDGQSGYERQGLVNYLVEVCDPCEESTYDINGISVSDFVTPAYYDTRGAWPAPYSFLGTVKSQLGILEGGSISWRPLLPQPLVYQASAPSPDAPGATAGSSGLDDVAPAKLVIRTILDGTSGVSVGTQRSPNRPAALARSRRHTNHTSWNAAGGSVRGDLKELLDYLKFISTHQPPSIDEVIALLEKLVNDDATWQKFSGSKTTFRAAELRKLGLTVPAGKLSAVPARDEYRKVLKYLKEQKKVAGIFGPDLTGNDAALWLCMQIG